MFFNTTLAQSPFFLFEGGCGKRHRCPSVVRRRWYRLRSNQNALAFSMASTNEATLPLVMFPLEHFSYIYFLALVEWLSVFNRISTVQADFDLSALDCG